jgi:outer membrane protein assembly factor BamB
MSTVYAARDLRFGQVERITAIKEMVDEDPDPGTRALRLVNFERESALLATIAHAAVPKIYDLFSQSGLVYLVIEYIDGSDLERALMSRGKPFQEHDIIRWTLEISSVLRMLHNYEPDPIIFRDLKPSNIMLRSSGQIALIDFGIARMFQGRQRGTMIGTEGYAPPEQYRGIADARGDIYALGATLHHLATNSDPRQETPFTFHERPVRTLNPEISEEFAAVISKMVAYHPDQRFQTVEEVERATEDLLYRKQRRDTEMLQRSPRPARPAPAHSEESDELPRTPQTSVFTGPIESVRTSPVRFERRRSSRKRLQRRKSERTDEVDRIAWQIQTGDEVRGSASWDGSRAVIGSYDRYLYALDPAEGTVNWKFPTGNGVVARPARAGSLFIFGSEDGSIYGVEAETGTLRWSCRTGRAVRSSTAVRDDFAIAGSDDGSVYCLATGNGDIVWRSRLWGPVRSTPVIADGKVIVGSDDGYLYTLDATTGKTIWREPCGGPVRSTAAVADGRVYIASWYGVVSCFAIESGRRIWQQGFDAEVASSPVVQGNKMLLGITDGALIALDATSGAPGWLARYSNQITSTALAGRELCYVGTIDGDCLAIEISSGELAWKHRIGGPIVSSPVQAGDVLVVGSLDGNVYGISLTDEETADLERDRQ